MDIHPIHSQRFKGFQENWHVMEKRPEIPWSAVNARQILLSAWASQHIHIDNMCTLHSFNGVVAYFNLAYSFISCSLHCCCIRFKLARTGTHKMYWQNSCQSQPRMHHIVSIPNVYHLCAQFFSCWIVLIQEYMITYQSETRDFTTIRYCWIQHYGIPASISIADRESWQQLGHQTSRRNQQLKAYLDTFNVTQMLNYGEDIRHDVTGKVVICQAIDYWRLGIQCQIQQVLNPHSSNKIPSGDPE